MKFDLSIYVLIGIHKTIFWKFLMFLVKKNYADYSHTHTHIYIYINIELLESEYSEINSGPRFRQSQLNGLAW